MTFPHLRPIIALIAVAALGACERHEWEDTKVLFKHHGEEHGHHGEEHGEDHRHHGEEHAEHGEGHAEHGESHGDAEKH